MININKMYCSGNNEVIKICVDERCSQNALMCGFQRCKCSEAHKLCKGVQEYQPLANQISQKATQLRKPFENLIFWYNTVSRQVLSDRDEMLKKIDQLIEKMLDQSESKFYQALNDGKSWKLTGEVMNKIATLSKKPSTANSSLDEQIKAETVRIGKDLQEQLAKLRKFWDFERDDKQSLDKLKKFGIKWTWLNGKWIKPVPEEFSLSELTGLGLDYIDPAITKLLAASCPKLEGLQVGCTRWVTQTGSTTPTSTTCARRPWPRSCRC